MNTTTSLSVMLNSVFSLSYIYIYIHTWCSSTSPRLTQKEAEGEDVAIKLEPLKARRAAALGLGFRGLGFRFGCDPKGPKDPIIRVPLKGSIRVL